jgi:hypothetical protein
MLQYIGLKNAQNIFQKTPQICFYRGKINQVGNPVSEKPVFSHVVSCNEVALLEILLLEKSWAKAHTAKHIFKKFSVKTTFKLKINLTRNNLNFSSFQPNHQ